MDRYPADIINGVKKKGRTSSTTITEMTQGTMAGAGVGLALGFMVGYYQKYNLLFSSIIGMAAGGLISRAFIVKK